MAPLPDPANHPHILLLRLPLEVIHTIFSFLATDSLANVSLTCHAALRAVAKLPTWTRLHFWIENVYNKREEFASAIERAVAVPQRAGFCGNATWLASHLVSITLDRDFLPVSLDLIFRILDSFTALREASFLSGALSPALSLLWRRREMAECALDTAKPPATGFAFYSVFGRSTSGTATETAHDAI
ncbi:hypothetical protein M427DRAFT_356308 [Gonapodya prolifera JEL478]|uniref:F-box domain-containing protein n=1 Tax=Gonapodya prolifera (strain JEL478) TaxID=1344416 RepID=A0A139ABC3_GONPJ|nr:hypothetical protein M427DRAFT_356308 [Gonapodya prolifera JEL478]|eukprot:KXS13969.1 hypothetical protein M427DRAFT_356308 [Gonapodya prolifera JEL478]